MKENFYFVSESKVKQTIQERPTYKVFWMSGFAFRGACERLMPKEDTNGKTFQQRLQRCFDWAVAMDMAIDHDKKEIHVNGFSANDMY